MIAEVINLNNKDQYFEAGKKPLDDLVLTQKSSGTHTELKKGAFPLSHNGICCIDGIEKIEKQQYLVEDVLRSGKVRIQQKSSYYEVDADCSILATIEPKRIKLKYKDI